MKARSTPGMNLGRNRLANTVMQKHIVRGASADVGLTASRRADQRTGDGFIKVGENEIDIAPERAREELDGNAPTRQGGDFDGRTGRLRKQRKAALDAHRR